MTYYDVVRDSVELKTMHDEISDIFVQDGSDKDKKFMITVYDYRRRWMGRAFRNGLAFGIILGSAITMMLA